VAAVIAVDAIAARDTRRLCSTVQLSAAGITPGSGIGNSRAALNQRTVGVPVIAVGVPTVTDAATMALDLMDQAGLPTEEAPLRRASTGMIVTCGDIDRRVREVARVLAFSINSALHGDLTLEELTDLTF
jgi:spore protease